MVYIELTYLHTHIRYILYRMEEAVDEESSEALERGGVHYKCPICFETKRDDDGYRKWCCGQRICKGCGENHRDTCARRSLEFTCPYCRALFLDREGNKRLLIKQGEYRIVYMTDI